MTTFRVSFVPEQSIISELSEIRSGVADIGATVRGQAASSIFSNFDRDGLVRKSLYDIADRLDLMNQYLGNCNDTVSSTYNMYRQTENAILGNGASIAGALATAAAGSPGLAAGNGAGNANAHGSENAFFEDFKQELGLSTVGQILEAAPSGVSLYASMFSAGYMPGPTGFAMYAPGSWQHKIGYGLAKVSPGVAKFGKIGLPIIGGVLDFAGQISKGEGAVHAGIKAAVHTGVGVATGWAATKAGSAIGAAIGSIIPGAGTAAGAAVGAVVGMVVGCVLTVAVNQNVIDTGYDRFVRQPVDRLTAHVGKTAQQISEGIKQTGSRIAAGVRSIFAPRGRALGTIFG
jgi:hypothetical protein